MRHTILKWTLLGLALLVLAPILSGVIQMGSGIGQAGTPALSGSLVVGTVTWLIAVVGAGIAGAVVSRLVDARYGMAAAGLALVWAAGNVPNLADLTRVDGAGSPVVAMAVDGLVLGALVAVVLFVVLPGSAGKSGETASSDSRDPRLQALLAAAGFAGAALVGAWLVAQDGRTGQAIAGAVVAGVFGGAVARVIAPALPLRMLVFGVPLTMLIAPLLGMVLTEGDIPSAGYTDSAFPLLRVMPAHWAAGLLIGLPIGAANAAGMIREKHPGLATA